MERPSMIEPIPPSPPDNTEALRDKANELQQTVGEQVVYLRDTTRSRMAQEVDRRSTEIGVGTQKVATALVGTRDELRRDGNDLVASVVDRTAEGLSKAGTYLQATDSDRIMSDVRDVARRMPWLIVAAGMLAGFAAARVVKAAGDGDRTPSDPPPMSQGPRA